MKRRRPASFIAFLLALALLWAGGAHAFAKDKANEKDKQPPAAAEMDDKDDEAKPDAPAAPPPTGKVYRYLGQKKGSLGTAQAMVLSLQDVFTNKQESLYVPNNDAASKAYDPLTAVASALKEIEPGTVVQVETEKQKGRTVVTSISKVDAKPGEELPNGFVFVESQEEDKGGVPNVIVTLSKFGREVKVGVPMIKDDDYEDAKWEPDPKVDYHVRRLQSGTVVEAQFRKSGRQMLLAEIYPYNEPERGKFVGLKEVEFKSWPAAGFEMLDPQGTTITFTLEGTEVTKNNQTVYAPNPQQLRAVKKLKPDTEIEVRYRIDGKTWIMRDIKLIGTGKPAKGGKTPDTNKMKEEKDETMTDDDDKPKAGKTAKG